MKSVKCLARYLFTGKHKNRRTLYKGDILSFVFEAELCKVYEKLRMLCKFPYLLYIRKYLNVISRSHPTNKNEGKL